MGRIYSSWRRLISPCFFCHVICKCDSKFKPWFWYSEWTTRRKKTDLNPNNAVKLFFYDNFQIISCIDFSPLDILWNFIIKLFVCLSWNTIQTRPNAKAKGIARAYNPPNVQYKNTLLMKWLHWKWQSACPTKGGSCCLLRGSPWQTCTFESTQDEVAKHLWYITGKLTKPCPPLLLIFCFAILADRIYRSDIPT